MIDDKLFDYVGYKHIVSLAVIIHYAILIIGWPHLFKKYEVKQLVYHDLINNDTIILIYTSSGLGKKHSYSKNWFHTYIYLRNAIIFVMYLTINIIYAVLPVGHP